MDQNQDRRRGGGHFHRGRRGPDRRGFERRTPPAQSPEHGRDQVDVEQIMRDIRSRISQQSGIEFSTQQIQDLAARRLEAILDPRAIRPGLLDELRKGAATPAQHPPVTIEPPYTFDDTSLYGSHRGPLRLIRRILNPILKLFFNPGPLVKALGIQAQLNTEAASREAARSRQQAEWNALHYELVQRLVTEVSRLSLEMQAFSGQVESLSAKLDFNERRVRGIEAVVHQPRGSNRPVDAQMAASAPPAMESAGRSETTEASPTAAAPQLGGTAQSVPGPGGEGGRRRRRRRRGRRGGGAPGEQASVPGVGVPAGEATDNGDIGETGDIGDEGPDDVIETSTVVVSADTVPPIQVESIEPPSITPDNEPPRPAAQQERDPTDTEG